MQSAKSVRGDCKANKDWHFFRVQEIKDEALLCAKRR